MKRGFALSLRSLHAETCPDDGAPATLADDTGAIAGDHTIVTADAVFTRAASGLPCWVRDRQGARTLLPLQRWVGNYPPGHPDAHVDEALLAACDDATLDLGCGPGRLTAALTGRGIDSLGVDASAVAVTMTHQRGGHGLHSDIYDSLPDTGQWRHVLLADGNVGIGGDPIRLLRRARELTAPGGTVIVELPPTPRSHYSMIRWETDSSVGRWFPWATLNHNDIEELANAAGLSLSLLNAVGGRWIAILRRPPQPPRLTIVPTPLPTRYFHTATRSTHD